MNSPGENSRGRIGDFVSAYGAHDTWLLLIWGRGRVDE